MVRLTYFGSTLTVVLPTLRHDLAIGQLGVAGLGKSAMAERRERQLIAQPAARMTSLTFRLMWVKSGYPALAMSATDRVRPSPGTASARRYVLA